MTQDQAEAALVRVGPFWDGIEGRVPVPPAAATLGFGFVDATADEITVSFEATPAFTNPMGEVLGPSRRPCSTTPSDRLCSTRSGRVSSSRRSHDATA